MSSVVSILQEDKDSEVDVVGVVIDGGEISQITTRTTHQQRNKRDIILIDPSNATIKATLWAELAENFEQHATRNPVVVMKGEGRGPTIYTRPHLGIYFKNYGLNTTVALE